MTKLLFLTILMLSLSSLVGCNDSNNVPVPRPRGYFRFPQATCNYDTARIGTINFLTNKVASTTRDGNKLTITYPHPWNAVVYCTFTPVTYANRDEVLENRAERMALNAGNGSNAQTISLQSPGGFDCSLLTTANPSPTPLQFIAASKTLVISGALLIQDNSKPDSIHPILEMVNTDILKALENL